MNKINLNKKNYVLNNLMNEIILDYKLKLTETNVDIELQEDSVTSETLLDRFWFTTIIQNLFDNAIKYNNSDNKKIGIHIYTERKNICIAVSDNGIGIQPETRKHIFDKFYRNTNKVNGQVKGLGLGLFYVKQAIDAHEWKIDIDSMPEGGSIFIIAIPV
jgi:two-component system phosphate regulon sensor histidine kinase PhoR